MKKCHIALGTALLALVGLGACSPKVKKVQTPIGALTSNLDSVAYALGVVNGNAFLHSFEQFPGASLDRKLVLEGFGAGMLKGDVKISLEDAQKYIEEYVDDIRQKELAEIKLRNDSALRANKVKEGVKTTESGLQYRVIRPATGKNPMVQDTVVAHYSGRTIDGKEFDSSYKRNQPFTFSLLDVIPGWTEGICLMQKGSKYEFYIPASLAYGERGAGRDIPPHSTLIFEVELLDIKPYVEKTPEAEAKAEPKKSATNGKKRKK